MRDRQLDVIRLLRKVSASPVRREVVYVNRRLLDDLFENEFGGVTGLLDSIERTSRAALRTEVGVGLGGVLANLFLDLKASIGAEGEIGEQTKTVIERELTLLKKIALCEASLDSKGLIVENPASLAITQGKYLKLVDLLPTFTLDQEESLRTEIGVDSAEAVLARWRREQGLTPNSPQVALAAPQPFCMAVIVKVQSDVAGSTYILYPPPPPKQRWILAEPWSESGGVAFLKTYWIIDVESEIGQSPS